MITEVEASKIIEKASTLVTIWSPWWYKFINRIDFAYSDKYSRITGLSSMIFQVGTGFLEKSSTMEVAIALEFALQQASRNVDVRFHTMKRRYKQASDNLVALACSLEINSDMYEKFSQLTPFSWENMVKKHIAQEFIHQYGAHEVPHLPDDSWTYKDFGFPPELKAESYLKLLLEKSEDLERQWLDNKDSDSEEDNTPDDADDNATDDDHYEKDDSRNDDADEGDPDEDSSDDTNDDSSSHSPLSEDSISDGGIDNQQADGGNKEGTGGEGADLRDDSDEDQSLDPSHGEESLYDSFGDEAINDNDGDDNTDADDNGVASDVSDADETGDIDEDSDVNESGDISDVGGGSSSEEYRDDTPEGSTTHSEDEDLNNTPIDDNQGNTPYSGEGGSVGDDGDYDDYEDYEDYDYDYPYDEYGEYGQGGGGDYYDYYDDYAQPEPSNQQEEASDDVSGVDISNPLENLSNGDIDSFSDSMTNITPGDIDQEGEGGNISEHTPDNSDQSNLDTGDVSAEEDTSSSYPSPDTDDSSEENDAPSREEIIEDSPFRDKFSPLEDIVNELSNDVARHEITVPEKDKELEDLHGADEIEKDKLSKELAQEMKEFQEGLTSGVGAGGIGLSDKFIDWYSRKLIKPRSSWKKILPRMLNSIAGKHMISGMTDMTFSKRNPNQQPDMPLMMGYISYPPTVNVIVDASPSMSVDKERVMTEFVSIVSHFFIQYGEPIGIIVADNNVKYYQKVVSVSNKILKIVSRTYLGGSNGSGNDDGFGETIRKVMNGTARFMGKKIPQSDILIIFTDGGFDFPYKDHSKLPGSAPIIVIVSTKTLEELKSLSYIEVPRWLKNKKNFVSIY